MTDQAVGELVPLVGVKAACQAVGRPRGSHYRQHRQSPPPPTPQRVASPQPRALSGVERKEVLRVLHDPEHVDEAPATVYAKLLDEGVYLASVSTMYRILRTEGEVRERRRQATHPPAAKPELLATRPNAVWSWDITKLLGPAKWTWFYLYVIIDIYSRYVPGWMLARAERAQLAERLLADTIAKQHISRDQLTIHADRGTSMASKPVAFLLADLGITKRHSRPRCSNDNPPARASSRPSSTGPSSPTGSAAWRTPTPSAHGSSAGTTQHRHSGIGFHPPADVHYGRAELVQAQRATVLDAAYAAHPERFVREPPTPPQLPTVAWINKPEEDTPGTTNP